MEKKHYGAIDGLRAIACLGIVMMHMKTNNLYSIDGVVYQRVITSLTNFVFLFMEISAFGLCCGYFERMISGKLSLTEFYKKRLLKTLPFFAVLILLDVALSGTKQAVYEGFTELTMMFGFLPNAGTLSVIGVGWFIGLVFVFYLCFPFFCTLLEKRKRAWCAFAVSFFLNIACIRQFGVERANMLYSGCFFMAGGMVYLYRDSVAKMNGVLIHAVTLAVIALYLIFWKNETSVLNTMLYLLVSTVLLMDAVAVPNCCLLNNRITHFFSGISMEIYLSHMVVFRALEKMGMNRMPGNGWTQYAVTVVMVFAGATVYSLIMQHIIGWVETSFERKTESVKRHENSNGQ